MMIVLGCALALLLGATSPGIAEVRSYAFVRPDGTLKIRGKTIRLHGVYVPQTGRHCDTALRPSRCGSRAAIALDRKIQGFVHCFEQLVFRDGSIAATCFVKRTRFSDGQDLGAFLITEGWAVAGPRAPFEYVVLERVARTHRRGIWGFQADSLR